ncbi:MAG: EamA family transporter [Opitutaceae bacterium]|nr:EamA family transporter [Opitutaceae bacterium]
MPYAPEQTGDPVMVYLILVSFIWAFSFGLTKGRLAGVDSSFVSAARLGLALAVFLPYLRWPGPAKAARFSAIGAVQFGAMYLALNESYRYLPSYLVALFTLTTPLLVVGIDSAKRPGTALRTWFAAGLSVLAGLVVSRFGTSTPVVDTLLGLGLVTIANACFAFGQISYRNSGGPSQPLEAAHAFAWMYLGAFLAVLPLAVLQTRGVWPNLSLSQYATLGYLGCLASGLCFFLWNVGATRVSTGVLAVLNNAKVPLAVVCSLVFFGETANPIALTTAFVLLGLAVLLVKR